MRPDVFRIFLDLMHRVDGNLAKITLHLSSAFRIPAKLIVPGIQCRWDEKALPEYLATTMKAGIDYP